MTLRERLRALFFPTRRLLTADATQVLAGGALGGVEWVVPRARCQYHRAEFSGLTPRRRQAAAALAARQHETAPTARSQVAWSGAVAHIWVWSENADEAAPPGAEFAWTPESLLRPAPALDGVRLLRLVDGFEGQYWRDGVLRASRWWGEPPRADAWGRFLRGCGLPAGTDVAVPEDPGWARQPWASRGWRLPASPARLERIAWQGVFGLLVLLAGWQLAAALTWAVARERLDSSLASLRAQATPLLEARERAETARGTLEGYRRLAEDGLSDYALMADVATGLPDDGQLRAWQRDRERLQVQVASAEADPRRFVSAYQSSDTLGETSATPGRDGAMQIDFVLATASGRGDGDLP
ncbi:hypothetical protein E4582_11245 [Luteimonas yindakuii]|uniref:Uncharacterized protein n=1 Tax=Luteimonas yindakuii TaxID=2565782 RepID=A0A4Z1R855_9GAMM|nr:hypothetical protein [Luteimonas yindakuii]TKS52808.1 hypothetical protein E4582_11245 [Luteimonas yindakuii]